MTITIQILLTNPPYTNYTIPLIHKVKDPSRLEPVTPKVKEPLLKMAWYREYVLTVIGVFHNLQELLRIPYLN
jgi:hypothetical protein